jgi:hypothetical protein
MIISHQPETVSPKFRGELSSSLGERMRIGCRQVDNTYRAHIRRYDRTRSHVKHRGHLSQVESNLETVITVTHWQIIH